ncbi:serine/threonine-protein kinase [Streptomyces sp. NPDC046685]|uniref:serine/threonine-protein kinase n=1 Tax=Streptomyces sp. NPDC046685 TaxID=3157202 RepID=UPI0034090E80
MLRPLGPGDPREVSGYRLLARIGEGGMGSVYLTRTRGRQPAALKVIRREYAEEPEFRRRFAQEIHAARHVRGYHLVPVLDHDPDGPQPWLATAYVPGLALDEALDVLGPLPVHTVLRLVAGVARGLEAVHAAGVVHRDLKPGNVMLAADGPWVIDFGIARAADSTRLTRSGGLVGTPQFMSPEQGTGGHITPASDVFSLGLIAAVAATGRHPYGPGGALTIATQIANTAERPPDLSAYPTLLRPVLERTLAADPAARPAPGELRSWCERLTDGDPADWLPEPWAAAVADRERELGRLSAEAPADGYVPTRLDAGPPSRRVGPGPSFPSTAPAQAPPYPATPPAAVRPPGRKRAAAAIAAAAALVTVAGTAWMLTGQADGGAAAGSGRIQSSPPTPDAGATAGGGAQDESDSASYKPLFKDRPLQIGSPAMGSVISVDLDTPEVSPRGRIGDPSAEITYLSNLMTLRTPMAKSPGSSPEDCRRAVTSAPLPTAIPSTELTRDGTVNEGDRLCTVTSEGNLAMLRITGVTRLGVAVQPPAFTGEVTLWTIPTDRRP